MYSLEHDSHESFVIDKIIEDEGPFAIDGILLHGNLRLRPILW